MTLDLFALLREEIRPALGCTEPAAVALACATAASYLEGAPQKVEVETDPNVFKNGMGVFIPGTKKAGLHLASALGALAGKPELELEVLSGCARYLSAAEAMVQNQQVTVTPSRPRGNISILARVTNKNGQATALIEGSHTHLVAACKTLPDDAYDFLLACARSNQKVARAGIEQKLGLGLGHRYQQLITKDEASKDLGTLALIATAGAADARMSGYDAPVYSTNGSGNQGITASLPVLTVGEELGKSDKEIAIALAISQIVTLYVKQHIGKLSALCACAVAAAIGASCGIVYLIDVPYQTLEETIKLMVANLTGMICDGAKVSCSLKLATAANTAVQTALLAKEGLTTPTGDGIIATTVEDTIRNLGSVSNPGMVETDNIILDVMQHIAANNNN